MISVLSRVTKAHLRTEPFPHFVIKEALDWRVFEQLEREYPSADLILDGKQHTPENTRHDYSAHKILGDSRISPLWRQFAEYHTSPAFFQEIMGIWGSEVLRLYPNVEQSIGKPMAEWSTGVRRKDTGVDFVLDCQIGINTPLSRPSSVRGAHVDNPVELYAGLLYFKPLQDESTGGDLLIYRYKRKDYRFHGKAELNERYVEKVGQVPYERNTLVFFINSINSVHGVTARSASSRPRRLVNIIGEFPAKGLFRIPRGLLHDVMRSARDWLGSGGHAPIPTSDY